MNKPAGESLFMKLYGHVPTVSREDVILKVLHLIFHYAKALVAAYKQRYAKLKDPMKNNPNIVPG